MYRDLFLTFILTISFCLVVSFVFIGCKTTIEPSRDARILIQSFESKIEVLTTELDELGKELNSLGSRMESITQAVETLNKSIARIESKIEKQLRSRGS